MNIKKIIFVALAVVALTSALSAKPKNKQGEKKDDI